MQLPQQVNAMSLTKAFMDLADERYPSADKVKRLARDLAIADNLPLQIIVFGLFRDAVHKLPLRLYRSPQHRDEVLTAIVEALEDFEEQVESQEEAQMQRELEEAKLKASRPKKTL